MNIPKFALLITGIAILLVGVSYFPLSMKMDETQLTLVGIAELLTWSTSLIAYAIVYNGLENNPKLFMGYIVGGMFIKMATGILGILLVSYGYGNDAVPFSVTFLITYMIFTGLEVSYLMKKARES